MDYGDMLKKGKENLPKITKSVSRFEIPKIRGHHQGIKTITTNLTQIANTLGRDFDFFLKYLTKALAAQAVVEGQRVIFSRRMSSPFINSKIEKFAKEYVLCPDCGKPDTKLVKEKDVLYIRCTACGAKKPAKQ